MSRSQFDTGQLHQRQVAVWVRRRLVDAKGVFHAHQHRTTQQGVILADGVGMGKTWEALAASALLLVEQSKSTKSGNKRLNNRQCPARLLVLCPPGLVSKWTREIRDPDGFRHRLEAWTGKNRQRRQFVSDTLTQPYEIRSRADLPPMQKKRNHRVFPTGAYICNWNVLRKEVGKGYSRLTALRRQEWDIVIVDEAHHREAKAAVKNIKRYSKIGQMILLTATPFQLDPKELHALFGAVLDHRRSDCHKVLIRPPVKQFVRGLEAFFQGKERPTSSEKREAEDHLRQVVTRSHVPTKGRRYYAIDADGSAHMLDPPPDHRSEEGLRDLRSSLIAPSAVFEAWYLRRRMELASCEGADRTFVPNKLRQALSTVTQARESLSDQCPAPPYSPKTEAIVRWARRQTEHDLRRFTKDGWPRKTLLFTSFVGKAPAELQRRLGCAVHEAWKSVRSSRDWTAMAERAETNLLNVQREVESRLKDLERVQALWRSRPGQRIVQDLRALIASLQKRKAPILFRDLFGHRHFAKLVVDDLTHRISILKALLTAECEEQLTAECEEQWQLHRDELSRLTANLGSLGQYRLVATYTGHDDRRNREASGEAFCSPLGPWILVASNVGSEGIDLQTYSAHLVHFDIEWNPARMEQREGRIDRVGRRLPDHVNVYYALVKDTYDERMLHQLVARQRWHAVLLGRQGARLAKDCDGNRDARLLGLKETRSLTLDLRPGR